MSKQSPELNAAPKPLEPMSAPPRAVGALLTLLVLGSLAVGCDSSDGKESASKAGAAALAAAMPSTTPVVATTHKEEATPPKEDPTKIECKEGPNVDFHDAGLEAEIRRKLEQPDGPVKTSDLAKVKSVNLARDPSHKVDYLDPCVFPHLTQVKDLFLGPGSLSDLTPLAKLTRLESLRLSMNQVSDLSPLKDLKKLDRLDLGYTQVQNLAPLAGLTSLTELQIDNTKVSDLTPLSGLTNLVRVSLQRTEVKDISPLKPLTKLKYVYIAGSRVEDAYSIARPGLQVSQE
ncbi:MAG TPA: leucine-rich repeat domain-containing protein [Polyangiaceae bacterium]|nr:leucine-rich repeat domain-containing protein [Polyangiaceae bacterium]